MIFPTPDKTKIVLAPPPIEGSIIRASIGNPGAQVLLGQETTEASSLKNGNHFFLSVFFKSEDLVSFPGFEKNNSTVNRFYADSDVRFSLNFSLPAGTGYLSEDTNWVQIDTSSFSHRFRFGARNSVAAIRRVNIDGGNWIWFVFYTDVTSSGDNINSTKMYLNGVDVTLDAQTAGAFSPTTGTSLQSTFSVRRTTNSATANLFSSYWLGTAADGSVIGQPEFLEEFVNEDGTAKDLGNGTVNGLVPHYYFTGASGANINEVDGKQWTATGDTSDYTLSSETATADWYGDPTRSYVFQQDINLDRDHYFYEPTGGTNKIFWSMFVKNSTGGDPISSVVDFIGDFVNSRVRLNLASLVGGTGGGFADGIPITGNTRQIYSTTNPIPKDTNWHHFTFYADNTNGNTTLTIDGVEVAVTKTTTTTTPSAIHVFLLRLPSPALFWLSNVVAYVEPEDAGAPVDFSDPNIWKSFMDENTGRPRDLGYYGDAVLGGRPSFYLNGAVRLGFNSNTIGGALLKQTVVGSPVNYQPTDTLSAEEDIIVSLSP